MKFYKRIEDFIFSRAFSFNKLFLDLCENYCSWDHTDDTINQNLVIYTPKEIVSNYSEYFNEVIPNVYDRTEIPDFINLDSSPWIYGDSIRYSLSKCDIILPSYSSDKPFYQPTLISGEVIVVVYKNNSVVNLIDYWFGTQFAIDVYVEGNTTLPNWIVVNQMMRQMIIIYDNVVSLDAFNTSIHVLSLSLNNYFTYNSSFIMILKNELPNINVLSLSNIFLMNKNNSYTTI